jgi:phosphate-selective porin OprO and OprP
MGTSFTHQLRDSVYGDSTVQYRTRPESQLTSDRLVDTGEFSADDVNIINPELAISFGSFAMQSEYFQIFVDANELGSPQFWGFYLYGSYLITGEHRNYDRSGGVFSGITPAHDFRLDRSGWGAWELGFRYSYVDLNDGEILGGKENNYTASLNWYLNSQARFMLNAIRASVKDRETLHAVDKGWANILQARFQLTF